MKEPAETISVSRCRFGGFFFIDVKLAGEILILPNLHLLTLIAFLLAWKKIRKTHIYSLLLHREFNPIFQAQLVGLIAPFYLEVLKNTHYVSTWKKNHCISILLKLNAIIIDRNCDVLPL